VHWRRTHSLDEELEFSKVGLVSTISSGVGTTVSVILDNNCMALTPIFDEVRPAYLYYFMQTVDLSPFAVATAVPSVMRGDVGSLQIFKPTHEEQDEIIRRIETAFAWLDNVVTQHARADHLLPKLDIGANWQLRAQWTFLFPTH
jgi:type I restriction enzyme S subunit